MGYTKPQIFAPTQDELERIGKKIAKHLSENKVVVAGDKKIRGKIKTK